MNDQMRKAIDSLIENLDSRNQSEKIMILALLVAGLIMLYLSIAFDPLRADIASLNSRTVSVETQIANQQSRYQEMLRQSQEDPNRFVNDRLLVLQREQLELDSQIQALAGDLVTPNQMTQILTTVLERQSGLELVSFQNVAAEPLRNGAANADQILQDTGELNFSDLDENEVVGQVYSHGLIIEFEGDFFSTLKYLRFLEDITGSFFWDSISFRQLEWPNSHVTLQIHTLSTDQGFIGV